MNSTELFEQYRPLLFSMAYNMLGSIDDAEDAVQDAYVRWARVNPTVVENPKAYLSAVVSRLCIDQLTSARSRREYYVGPWIPEPLVTDPSQDRSAAHEDVIVREGLSIAVLLLLERLTPLERCVFLLHDVFSYTYGEIARMLERTEGSVRQVGSRARRTVQTGRQRFEASPMQKKQLLERLLAAVTEGELSTLLRILRDDVVLQSDGGGKVTAARLPITGADRVARFMLGLRKSAGINHTIRVVSVNGEPGALISENGVPVMVLSIACHDEKFAALYAVLNPDKLRHVVANDHFTCAR